MTEPTLPTEVSVIEKTRIPLDVSTESALGLLSTTAKQRPMLSLDMQQQCHSNWCWAAVAASISAFYDKSSTFTQCLIANLELNRQDTCDYPCQHEDNQTFNQIHEPGSALNRVGCLDHEIRNQLATRAEVQQEIDAGRPVCLRTVWTKVDGAHAVAIVDYLPDSDTLALEDPLFGPTHGISYDRFCTDYPPLGGQWTDTCYTKAAK